jgi:feruloyl esterase
MERNQGRPDFLPGRSIGLVISAGSLAALLLGATQAVAAPCESLTALVLPHTKITIAQQVPAGSFTAPNGQVLTNLPAFCRVVGVATPTSDSNINFEVWLPTSTWNGRYRQVGSASFGGSIRYTGVAATSLSQSLRSGYATAATDGGHVDPTTLNVSWALGHPQKIIDYGYRALKETTDAAKAVITAYYGRGPDRSYFDGCSNGGREALMEAQRYPDDFDGILLGDPAIYETDNAVTWAWDEQALTKNPAAFLPASKLPALAQAVLKQCAAREGLATDPFVNDPRDCHFDPAVIRCTGADSDSCLTTAQVEAVRKIYSGPIDPRTGRSLFPGIEPSAEDTAASDGTGGWASNLDAPPGNGVYALSGPIWSPTIRASTYSPSRFRKDLLLRPTRRSPVKPWPRSSTRPAPTCTGSSGTAARSYIIMAGQTPRSRRGQASTTTRPLSRLKVTKSARTRVER